jgi:hypothetical protein
MTTEYKHHRYFRFKNNDNSLYTFSDVSDARSKIALDDERYNIGSPTRTYQLVNSNKGLKMTTEFNSKAEQDSFITEFSTWSNQVSSFALGVEVYRLEWLHKDGSVSSTFDLDALIGPGPGSGTA